ncbi:Hypothetical Protein FCC1311_075012 [Hondaea fermentalgiana]|uniref:Uncharacterized protein n=1 Tax=Hondaea fermentalgiana TaxID=2315210 RepID=A0A2R5GNF9_9STRA|nr:Hypothetical Protein FCC1311_075012 [Hondaea fermentalgiana]|eukprot:GBG31278.1 Hypothetical Protein FCC1311_075012 [Hondaea fermentalgiana]
MEATTATSFRQKWMKLHQEPLKLASRDEAARLCGVDVMAKHHVDSILDTLDSVCREKNKAEPWDETSLFLTILGADGKHHLLHSMCQSLLVAGKAEIHEWEFLAFLAQLFWTTGCTKATKKKSFELLSTFMRMKGYAGMDVLLDLTRFNTLQKHFRGFPPQASANASSHLDETDNAAKMHSLEEKLAEITLRLFANKNLRVTIDDRNRGTVSTSTPVNTYRPRKRHQNGAGSDASADAIFRVKLFSQLYSRQYNQAQVLEKTLQRIKDATGADVAGVQVCLNRGNPSEELYKVCARLGFDLIVINDKERHQGNPFLSLTAHKDTRTKYVNRGWATSNLNIHPEFLVDDAPELGSEIFAASKSLTRDSGRSNVIAHAYAVREYGDAKRSRIHRFVSMLPSDIEDVFKNTFVFESFGRVPESIAQTWLFYPASKFRRPTPIVTADSEEDMETSSVGEGCLDDGDITLDGDDYEDEEYESNSEVCEGEENPEDASACVAHCDDEVCDASQSDRDRTTNLSHNEDTEPLSNEPMTDAMRRIIEAPSPERKDVEAHISASVVPLTAGQRCADWFMFKMLLITGTSAQQIAKEDVGCRPFLYEDPSRAEPPQALTSSALSRMLCAGWFHDKNPDGGRANRAMAIGVINESEITRQLRKEKFVDSVFEIGLVQKKGRPGLGVSADNIIVIRPPGETNPAARIVAPLETKTKNSPRAQARLTKVSRRHGPYFCCNVGSSKWFEAVPTESRGHLLHQAAIYDSEYVVFCVGTTMTINYVVLIRSPLETRQKWLQAFEEVEHRFINWAYAASPALSSSSIPCAYSEEDRKLLASRLPLWSAYHSRLKSCGVFVPVRLTRSLVQYYYSASKQGVDGLDAFSERFESRAVNTKWETDAVIGMVTDVLINALIVWRIIITSNKLGGEWQSLEKFQQECSRSCHVSDFVQQVTLGLLAKASGLKRSLSNEHVIGNATESGRPVQEKNGHVTTRWLTNDEHAKLRIPNGKRDVIQSANTNSVKKLRLSGNPHPEPFWEQYTAIFASLGFKHAMLS